MKRMKVGKAMGPDDIPIKVWRCLGDLSIVWLTKMFNNIYRSNKMPKEWRRAYWYQSTRTRETSKVALIIGELS